MNKIVIAFLALGALLAISACNTLHGLGQDVKSVGQSVENASNTH